MDDETNFTEEEINEFSKILKNMKKIQDRTVDDINAKEKKINKLEIKKESTTVERKITKYTTKIENIQAKINKQRKKMVELLLYTSEYFLDMENEKGKKVTQADLELMNNEELITIFGDCIVELENIAKDIK